MITLKNRRSFSATSILNSVSRWKSTSDFPHPPEVDDSFVLVVKNFMNVLFGIQGFRITKIETNKSCICFKTSAFSAEEKRGMMPRNSRGARQIVSHTMRSCVS